jgi:molybdopterin-guanine dinucleotide biosynthesis protein A
MVRLLEQLAWPGPTLLVTAPGREHPPGAEAFDAEAVDAVAGEGPLRGVLTALEHATTERVVAVPVDMPDVSRGLLAWLAERVGGRPDAAAVMIQRSDEKGDRRIEPLPAAFRRAIAAPLVRAQLAQRMLALHELSRLPQDIIESCPRDCDDNAWTNLNVPADVAAWRSRFSEDKISRREKL